MFTKYKTELFFLRPTLTSNKINTIAHMFNFDIDIENKEHYKKIITNTSEHLYRYFPKKTIVNLYFLCQNKKTFILPYNNLRNIYINDYNIDNYAESIDRICSITKDMINKYIENGIIKGILMTVKTPQKEELFLNELDSYFLEYRIYSNPEITDKIKRNIIKLECKLDDMFSNDLKSFNDYDNIYKTNQKEEYLIDIDKIFSLE